MQADICKTVQKGLFVHKRRKTMIRTRLLVELALLGFVGTVLGNATASPPTAAQIVQQLPSLTPTPGVLPPDASGARGFDLGAAGDPYFLDHRVEGLLDN
jgi:hypothetical protein